MHDKKTNAHLPSLTAPSYTRFTGLQCNEFRVQIDKIVINALLFDPEQNMYVASYVSILSRTPPQ